MTVPTAIPTAIEVSARPAPPLRGFVSSYVGFRFSGFPAGVHFGAPTAELTAVISLAAPLEVALAGASSRERFGSVVSGLTTRAVAIHHDGEQFGVKLSLTPSGARVLYRMPAAALAGSLVSLEDVLRPLGDELFDRLHAAATWEGRFRVLDEVLSRAVGRGVSGGDATRDLRPEVAETWRRLVATRGQIQVSALASELGWSRRHLSEQFRRELGVTPKALARILRFAHAHQLAAADVPPTWADVASVTGYADQAHLVRDWRAFTGRSPTAWRREEVLLPSGVTEVSSAVGVRSPARR